jgi:diguanylate cyclase (GGDEF)-like protein
VLVVRSWLVGLERSYHRAAAITDPISGAFNHRYLHERLSAQMTTGLAEGNSIAVGVLDIDGFRVINAMHGQAAGDKALVGIRRVLAEEGGPDSAVYRLGGDEFAFVAENSTAEQATEIARRTISRVGREIEFAGSPIGLSAGIAMFPAHAFDSEQIVARAIAAQQLARVSEDADVVVYDEAVVGATDPLERLARARKHSHRATVKALAAAVDSRDPDTRHHSQNVADLATALALVLDVSEEQTHVIELAAQMHDVGKLGVTDEVLLKSEPLSADDQALVQEHPVLGERILAAARLDEILPAVRHHHERWDGKGYPDGLSGYDIPLAARMLSVCDAFEAMTSVRRYRQTLSVPQAISEIERCAGTQFDPDIAHVFGRMVGRLHGQALRDSITG